MGGGGGVREGEKAATSTSECWLLKTNKQKQKLAWVIYAEENLGIVCPDCFVVVLFCSQYSVRVDQWISERETHVSVSPCNVALLMEGKGEKNTRAKQKTLEWIEWLLHRHCARYQRVWLFEQTATLAHYKQPPRLGSQGTQSYFVGGREDSRNWHAVCTIRTRITFFFFFFFFFFFLTTRQHALDKTDRPWHALPFTLLLLIFYARLTRDQGFAQRPKYTHTHTHTHFDMAAK